MNKFVLSLLVPVVALLGWTINLEYHKDIGQEARIRIKGYDPRDLLSGHYIRYRLDLGAMNVCSDSSQPVCICLDYDSDGKHQIASAVTYCNSNFSSCNLTLKGKCSSGQFLAGVERYSIPESLAPALTTLPENSSVILSLDYQGNGQVKKVLVEEESLEEFALKKLNTQKQ